MMMNGEINSLVKALAEAGIPIAAIADSLVVAAVGLLVMDGGHQHALDRLEDAAKRVRQHQAGASRH